MSELARRYAQALYEVMPDETGLRATAEALMGQSELWATLCAPTVRAEEKKRLLGRLPELDGHGTLLRFYRLLAEKDRMALLPEILEAFRALGLREKNTARCVLTCVRTPEKEELERIRQALCKLHHRADIQFEIRTDPSLVGGFTLELEGIRYDKSVRGAMAGLSRYLEERRMA